MTLLLFGAGEQLVGRAELNGDASPPRLIVWMDRTFVWFDRARVGEHKYIEETPVALLEHDVRRAPASQSRRG